MRIPYNSSLWSKEKGPYGLPQRINWQFEYGGLKRCIPVIYRFPKGIVFDIITFLDEIKLRQYFEKYKAIEDTLTPLQRRCAEQEHPYQAASIKEVWINGKGVQSSYSSSSSVSISWVPQDDILASVREAYASILKDTSCFACERYCVTYPEADSKVQKLLRFLRLSRVDSIKLSTYSVQCFFPLDMKFEMTANDNSKEICFKHPVTGIVHKLYFQNPEYMEIPLEEGKPYFHIVQLNYEIEPALPQGDNLQFDSSIQYTMEQLEGSFSPTAVSSIGIIGSAHGPTSIFLSGKSGKKEIPQGLHELPLYNCFSVPNFQKDDTYHFILEGINVNKYDGREYKWQKNSDKRE